MCRVRRLIHRGRLAFKRRYVARGLILIYHRIAEDPVDPWRLCVFARELCASHGDPSKEGLQDCPRVGAGGRRCTRAAFPGRP